MPRIPRIQQVRPLPQGRAPRLNPSTFRAPQIDAGSIGARARAQAQGMEAEAGSMGLNAKEKELSLAAQDASYKSAIMQARGEEEARAAQAESSKALANTFGMMAEFGDSIAKVGEALFHVEQETLASQGIASMRESLNKATQDYLDSPDARGLPQTVEKLSQQMKAEWLKKIEGKAAMRFGVSADNIATAAYTRARDLERRRILNGAKTRDEVEQQRLRAQWGWSDPSQKNAIREELRLHHKALYDAGFISSDALAARLLNDDLFFNEASIREVIQMNPKRVYDALRYMQDHPRGTPAKAPDKFRDITTWAARLDPTTKNKLLDTAHNRYRQQIDDAERTLRFSRYMEDYQREQNFFDLTKKLPEGKASWDDVEKAFKGGAIRYKQYKVLKDFYSSMGDNPPNPRAYMDQYMQILMGRATPESLATAPVPAADRVKLLGEYERRRKTDHYSKQPNFKEGEGIVKTGLGFPPGVINWAGANRQKANRLNAALVEYNRLCDQGEDPLRASELVVAKYQAMPPADFSRPIFRFGTWRDLYSATKKTVAAYRNGRITKSEFLHEIRKIRLEQMHQDQEKTATRRLMPTENKNKSQRKADTYK